MSETNLHVPQDIIIDIFYRLPAKSLARFRCVSKLWLSILTHFKFIKTHLNMNIENEKLLVVYHSHSLRTLTLTNRNNYVSRKLNFPSDLVRNWSQIVGSCGGLVLAIDTKIYLKGLFLINPTTSKYKKLPKIQSGQHQTLYIYGFGYDEYSDDFKVVRLPCSREWYSDNSDVFVDVYSLKANCWTRIEVSPFYYISDAEDASGVLLRGAIHWTASMITDYTLVIVAFDLSTEKFREVEVPRGIDDANSLIKLVVLDYCLCMISENYQIEMDVWMMKEYGVQGSWIKLIRLSNEFHFLISGRLSGGPDFAVSKCVTGELEIFNLKEERIRRFVVDGSPAKFRHGWTFVESLVSPNFNC